ncbi:MAG: MFS transporter [Anaerolineales bacterium]|nr:MFS transporter [Anaerolineales bacterium]
MITINEKTLPSENRGAIAKTVCYYIAFIAFGLVTGVFGPTLPRLAENTHTGIGDIGFLLTARSLGYVLGSYLSGKLYDRLPGHWILLGILVTLGGMVALVPVIPMLWLLMLILIVLGMTEGSLDVGGNVLLLWVHGAKVGPYINGLHFFLGVGAFISLIIVTQVVLVSGDITWFFGYLRC